MKCSQLCQPRKGQNINVPNGVGKSHLKRKDWWTWETWEAPLGFMRSPSKTNGGRSQLSNTLPCHMNHSRRVQMVKGKRGEEGKGQETVWQDEKSRNISDHLPCSILSQSQMHPTAEVKSHSEKLWFLLSLFFNNKVYPSSGWQLAHSPTCISQKYLTCSSSPCTHPFNCRVLLLCPSKS